MLLNGVVLPEAQKVHEHGERKLVCMATAKILSEVPVEALAQTM